MYFYSLALVIIIVSINRQWDPWDDPWDPWVVQLCEILVRVLYPVYIRFYAGFNCFPLVVSLGKIVVVVVVTPHRIIIPKLERMNFVSIGADSPGLC